MTTTTKHADFKFTLEMIKRAEEMGNIKQRNTLVKKLMALADEVGIENYFKYKQLVDTENHLTENIITICFKLPNGVIYFDLQLGIEFVKETETPEQNKRIYDFITHY